MFYPRKTQIGESGQALTDLHVKTRLKWIYRPQPFTDIGIDGEIEVTDENGRSTGILAKVQVKTSETFSGKTEIKIPIDRRHLQYWQSLQLPVLLVAVDLKAETAYWLPIDSSMSIPAGQESLSFRVPLQNVLSLVSKASLLQWLETAPQGVIGRLLTLALVECEDIPVDQIPVGSEDKTDQERAVSEVVGMAERLGEIFDGILTHKDVELMGQVNKLLCQKRVERIQDMLNSLSDQTADGTVEISVSYDVDNETYTIRASGCVSIGTDNDGNPLWSDDVNGETKGRWSGEDYRRVLQEAESALCDLANEWETNKRAREGDEFEP